jgi:hypothetical protein
LRQRIQAKIYRDPRKADQTFHSIWVLHSSAQPSKSNHFIQYIRWQPIGGMLGLEPFDSGMPKRWITGRCKVHTRLLESLQFFRGQT